MFRNDFQTAYYGVVQLTRTTRSFLSCVRLGYIAVFSGIRTVPRCRPSCTEPRNYGVVQLTRTTRSFLSCIRLGYIAVLSGTRTVPRCRPSCTEPRNLDRTVTVVDDVIKPPACPCSAGIQVALQPRSYHPSDLFHSSEQTVGQNTECTSLT